MSYKTHKRRHRKRKGKKQKGSGFWGKAIDLAARGIVAKRRQKGGSWAAVKRWNSQWGGFKTDKFAKYLRKSIQKGGISWVTPGIVPRRYNPTGIVERQLGYGKKATE